MKKFLALAAGVFACALPATALAANVPGYDSVTLSTIPANAQVVGGYVAGKWPTYDSVVAAFPHALHLSIAVQANETTHNGRPVNCLDIEPFDAVNSQAPQWVKTERALGEPEPCVYTPESNDAPLITTLTRSGVPRGEYVIWEAHYTGIPVVAPGVDAEQWTDHAFGRNLDADLFSPHFLQAVGLVAVTPQIVVIGGAQHYELYSADAPAKPNRERQSVMGWDSRHCENPVRRQVCVLTRAHLLYDLSRDQAMFRRDSESQRLALHLPGRIQGIVHRIDGKGVVRRWM